jgi:hypothetical protein
LPAGCSPIPVIPGIPAAAAAPVAAAPAKSPRFRKLRRSSAMKPLREMRSDRNLLSAEAAVKDKKVYKSDIPKFPLRGDINVREHYRADVVMSRNIWQRV